MTPLQLAHAYMNCVFVTNNFDELRNILDDNLQFKGPLYEFDTADGYVDSLRNDPPVGFDYQIIKAFEDHSSACLVYNFSKPGIETNMTQLFETENGKIKSILLVFDTGAF